MTEHEIIVKGMLLRRHRSRAHAARVVRGTIVTRQASGEVLFVLDAHGDVLIKVDGDGFGTADLDRFGGRARAALQRPEHALSLSELGRLHPGLVPWSGRHTTLLGCAFSFVLLAVIMGLLIITA